MPDDGSEILCEKDLARITDSDKMELIRLVMAGKVNAIYKKVCEISGEYAASKVPAISIPLEKEERKLLDEGCILTCIHAYWKRTGIPLEEARRVVYDEVNRLTNFM